MAITLTIYTTAARNLTIRTVTDISRVIDLTFDEKTFVEKDIGVITRNDAQVFKDTHTQAAWVLHTFETQEKLLYAYYLQVLCTVQTRLL